jgi:hypothetical protein
VDGLNDWNLCSRLTVRCRLPGIATANRLAASPVDVLRLVRRRLTQHQEAPSRPRVVSTRAGALTGERPGPMSSDSISTHEVYGPWLLRSTTTSCARSNAISWSLFSRFVDTTECPALPTRLRKLLNQGR